MHRRQRPESTSRACARASLKADIYRKNREVENALEEEERLKQKEKASERRKQDEADYRAARDAFCEAEPGYYRVEGAGFFTGQWVRPDGIMGDDFMSFDEWMRQHHSEREEVEDELKKSAHQL